MFLGALKMETLAGNGLSRYDLNKLWLIRNFKAKFFVTIRDHPLSTYTKFSEKLTILTP